MLHPGSSRPVDPPPVVLWTTDPKLRVTATTGSALARLGLEADGVVGTTLFDSFGPDPDALPITAHRRALIGESVSYELSYLGRMFAAHVGPLVDSAGRVVGIAGVGLDVTDGQQEGPGRETDAELPGGSPASWGAYRATPAGRYLAVNAAFAHVLGYPSPEAFMAAQLCRRQLYPHADVERAFLHLLRERDVVDGFEHEAVCSDGARIWLREHARATRDRRGRLRHYDAFTEDVTSRRAAVSVLHGQSEILARLAQGEPLARTLDAVARLVEREAPGVLASIMVLEDGRLRHGAAPSLPPRYVTAVNGMPIGPCAASCGTAAYRREPVLVRDVRTDPLWANHRDLARRSGIRACWSTPVVGADGAVLGTLTLHDRTPRAPGRIETLLMGIGTHLAGVAIERDRRLQASARSDARLRAIIEAEPECVKLLDADGRVLEMNPAGLAMIEADTADQVVGQSVLPLVVRRDRPAFAQLTRQVFCGRGGRAEFEIVGLKGARRWLETHAVPLRDSDGRVTALLGITRDVTTAKRAELALRESREQLRNLAAREQEILEAERARISREIHDVLGQALTALKLELAAVRDMAATGERGVAERLGALLSLVDSLVRQGRRLSAELRPPVLDALGLAAAVEWLAEDFTQRTGLPCRTCADLGDKPVPREVATAAFRITQEALTNVARHAAARVVHVSVAHAAGALALEVRDDGRGITMDESGAPGALGILGMRERAALLGGTLTVVGAAGRGTRLAAEIPLA